MAAWLGMVVLTAYFVAGFGFLAVRYLVLPNVGAWRTDIASLASEAIGAPVKIGAISADWDGFRPRLHLRGVDILDGYGQRALGLDRIDATLAWSSLIRLRPYFDRLELFQPEVELSRNADGTISVVGLPSRDTGGQGGLDWVLAQRQMIIRDATLTWTDRKREAPPLTLKTVNLRLDRSFRGHGLGLTATCDNALFDTLEVRAAIDFGSVEALSAASGRTYVKVNQASVAALSPWLDLPLGLEGQGDVAVWVDWTAGMPKGLQTRFSLVDVRLQLDPARPVLGLAEATGEVALTRRDDGFSIQTQGFALKTQDGMVMAPSDVILDWQDAAGRQSVELKANQLDLAVLSALARSLPMTASQASLLAALTPTGLFRDLSARWAMVDGVTTEWSLKTRADNLTIDPSASWPGVKGLSGQIDGSDQGGRYVIASQAVALSLPEVFVEPLAFSFLNAEGSWGREAGRTRFSIGTSSFENADLKGEASGHYFLAGDGPGEIDLQARLSEADGAAVWRYLPRKVNAHTRAWLQRGIVRGTAHDARLRLKGPLSRFPYRNGEDGVFLITAQVDGAVLDYAPGWPQIDDINGALRFDGPGMTITASQGVISGVRLSDVVADVPDLANGAEAMIITGKADGQTRDFLQFITDSPVRGRINGFTDAIAAEGSGHLDLRLEMPLRHVKDTQVAGQYRFSGNRLRLLDALPWMEAASGTIGFTGTGLTIDKATATALGGPVNVTARTDEDGTVRFAASGEAHADALAAAYPIRLLEYLSGRTPWALSARVGKGSSLLEVTSTLEGLGASLPAPFNKSANGALPTSVTLHFKPAEPVLLEARLGDSANATLSFPRDDPSAVAGGVGIGTPARAAPQGILLAWKQARIDLDHWRQLLGDGSAAPPDVPLAGLSISADVLQLRRQPLHDLQLRAERQGDDWRAEIRSREAEGTISWVPQAEGRLVARLSRLTLGKRTSGDEAEPAGEAASSFPALDVEAERFGVNGLDLGRLKLTAFNREGVWHLNDFSLDAGTTQLTGTGLWASAGNGRTELDFKLRTDDVGALLTRLDFPDAVQRGTATLDGKLSWQGGPAALDYPTMNGAFELLAESGQFKKLDPGVGRLLGVLSLQSLPRRITLDFRDVFSEGFAFDRISGSIDMARGVLTTGGMNIRGPAAVIELSGRASVPDETQDLQVKVQPTLSESVAVGAALGGAVINPVAGVVTYIVQKALEDPVEKLFAFEYEVTGTWADPVVRKLGKNGAATAGDAPRSTPGGPRN